MEARLLRDSSRQYLVDYEKALNKNKQTLLVMALKSQDFELFNRLIDDNICEVNFRENNENSALDVLMKDYHPDFNHFFRLSFLKLSHYIRYQACLTKLLAHKQISAKTLNNSFLQALDKLPIREQPEYKGWVSLSDFLKKAELDQKSIETGLTSIFKNTCQDGAIYELQRSVELYDFFKNAPYHYKHSIELEQSANVGPKLKAFLQTERYLKEYSVNSTVTNSAYATIFVQKPDYKKYNDWQVVMKLNQIIRDHFKRLSASYYENKEFIAWPQVEKINSDLSLKLDTLKQDHEIINNDIHKVLALLYEAIDPICTPRRVR